MDDNYFPPRELEVMSILWRLGSATVADVRTALQEDLAYTSVLSALQTLEEKGYVDHAREGRVYRYHPLVKAERAGRSALARIKAAIFHGSAERMFAQMLAEHGLSRDELQRMRRLLAERLRGGTLMLTWLLYVMLVGGLLTLAAHCVGKVCHLFARPTRWVWVSALALTVILAGVAPYRAAMLSRAQSTHRAAPQTGSEVRQQAFPSTGKLPASVQFVRREMTIPLQETITIPVQRVPASLDAYLAVVWCTLSVVVLLGFSMVYLRFRRARREWPVTELHGVRVRIAPDGGPVVIGVRHPEIVIPQWLLGRSAEEQRVVLTHEQEHIRAGDPWVLAGACIMAALLPWHPLVWWMVSRLRLAIELDCDTRVLRLGIAPQTYGTLLIDLAARCSGLPVRALALADNRSHLKQRLLAMRSLRPQFAAMQGLFFGSSALLLLVTACVAQVPVRADRISELARQRAAAEQDVEKAEQALETFRARDAQMLRESNHLLANQFFEKQSEYNNAKRDREAMDSVAAHVRAGTVSLDDINAIPKAANVPDLMQAVKELLDKEHKLRDLRQSFTAQYEPVQSLDADVQTLRKKTIPTLAANEVDRLLSQEHDLRVKLYDDSLLLTRIPEQSIEEGRLRRNLVDAEHLYTSVRNLYEAASLGTEGTTPDGR